MAKQLLESIEHLRAEMQQLESLDPEKREELFNTLSALEEALAGEGAVIVDQHQPLIEQLKQSLWQFEKTHPTLTVIVGRVMDNLARMGI